MRLGMVIDLKKCVGCYSCVVSCKIENFVPPDVFWSRLEFREFRDGDGAFRRVTIPVQCMHCGDPDEGEQAPCQRVCPTGATQKRDDGIVTIDPEACVGCRYCLAACPYNARTQYVDGDATMFPGGTTPYEEFAERFPPGDHRRHPTGTVGKCEMCRHRVDDGMAPKCATQCPAEARYFGDINDPDSHVSRLVDEHDGFRLNPELGTNPAVYYLPPR